ncbi:acyl carrier protein [Burkholderia lata]|uniref:D-alanine--poly(Phosphoribitol) ligase subunit 2 n=1 Tax=Burkholderia lata (strain ATCC 17760 / DSM 23089 / LMG 22485 / NCIMB 9086 / R18194 / 383) TaxID=482957 RepID=A0A6P2ZM71_BURL3|nr:acyl carrier protein [Burkholderia lata]VWD35624.1 D-alanine--poly(phosphoribitol) ligase subunit 2 [Burkholderia lata]
MRTVPAARCAQARMNECFWSVIVMRMMSLDELIDNVKTFLAGIDPGASARVTAQTNLLDANLLDSLSLVHFVLFIEQTLRIEIPIGDFVLDSIASVAAIYDHYVLGTPRTAGALL